MHVDAKPGTQEFLRVKFVDVDCFKGELLQIISIERRLLRGTISAATGSQWEGD